MSRISKRMQTKSPGAESSYEFKVLVMCEEGPDAAVWRELLRLPGCTVQMCHNPIELLLFLEHEMFQLVMIFEGERPSSDSHAAAKLLAEARKETAVLVVRRPAGNEYLTETLESPN